MKKKIFTIMLLTAMVGILGFNTLDTVNANNNQISNTFTIQDTTDTNLTQDEIDDLLFMREEEKLARDVYLTLYEKWDLALFNNIARSEQRHMDAVKTLINNYELDDPILAEVGEFTNQDLQALYDDLIMTGSQSISDALLVGGAIEEIDILDLQDSLKETNNSDITRIFESLLQGSYSHLKAFVQNYNRQTGETYEPQFMSGSAFDKILAQTNSNGQPQTLSRMGRRGGRR